MATKQTKRPRASRPQLDPQVQERLRDVAAELRGMIYGEKGCPEWGTLFKDIEADGMSVGLELARLLMEQSTSEQVEHMPLEAMQVEEDRVQPAGTDSARLETPAGEVACRRPARIFFPQLKALGLDIDQSLSPELLEKATCLGTVLSSFPQAHAASERLLEQELGIKRLQRLTERIGAERVAQRDAQTEAFLRLPLMEKQATPRGVKVPDVVAVMPDGGRLQLCSENEKSRTHWHEYKAGCLKILESPQAEKIPVRSCRRCFCSRCASRR